MSRGVNKVILVGHLGADPETRYTNSGTAVTELRIATSESWTDKQSGERQERTEWHRVTLWGKLAEIAGEYLKKGRQVYIEGSLRTEEYEKDGITRYSTKVNASDMQMLGGGGDNQQGGGQRSGGGGQQRGSGQRQQRAQDRHTQLDQRDSYRGGYGSGGGQGRQDRGYGTGGGQQQNDNSGGFEDDEIPF